MSISAWTAARLYAASRRRETYCRPQSTIAAERSSSATCQQADYIGQARSCFPVQPPDTILHTAKYIAISNFDLFYTPCKKAGVPNGYRAFDTDLSKSFRYMTMGGFVKRCFKIK